MTSARRPTSRASLGHCAGASTRQPPGEHQRVGGAAADACLWVHVHQPVLEIEARIPRTAPRILEVVATGSAGRLKWEGPFPPGLTVRFDEG